MKWNDFFQSIKTGDIAPVYLFEGAEEHVKVQALRRLREALLPPGLEALNDATLEGVTAQQITDAAETLPVMCERRIVTVMDWAPLMPGRAKNEAAEAEWIERWLDNPPTSCVTVFWLRAKPEDANRRKKGDVKKLAGLFARKAVIVEFDYLTDAELAKWCAAQLKPLGERIGSKALGTLSFMAGRGLTRLSGELDKLAAYSGDRGEISEQDVRAVVSPSLEFDVYELLNQLLGRDMAGAQQTANRLMMTGRNAVSILSTLTWQIRQLTHMRSGLDAGDPLPVIQKRLGMGEWQARMTSRQCARLSAKWLAELYRACGECDYAVKSGRMRDQDALSDVMFRIGLSERR